jgi:hypothetical protein
VAERERGRTGGARAAIVPALAVLAALLVLSGCGGSSDNGVASKSGKEILAVSKEAAGEASSVHVVGKTSQGLLTLAIDLQLTDNGGRGSVSLLGSNFEVVRLEGSVYVKGSPAFYKRLEATLGVPLKLQPGTWLKGSASKGPLSGLAAFTELHSELNRILSTPGSLATGATTTINGQTAVAIKETTKLYKGVLYVATTGKPYPIALVKTKGKAKNEREGGRITFSEWDRPVSLSAPSPWVDVATLKR